MCKMEEKPTSFLSSRGAKKLGFKGFSYSKDREDSKRTKTYWRCDDRKCKGRIITSDETVIKETPHDLHGPDSASVVVQQSIARMRDAAQNTREAPSKLVNKELASSFPPEYRGYWPKEASVKRTIQRQRRKVLPEIPSSLSEINLPEAWQKSSTGEQWLMCDHQLEGNERILVFCSDMHLRHLCRSPIWYGDGTFSVAPQHFYQLYTLHGVVMGQLLPLAFCILTRKTRIMYREMFQSICDQAAKRDISVAVTQFRMDFEDACIKAFQEVFPNAHVECCFFHLAQAHWRKIGDLGIRTTYVEDENFAISMRMFTALAFVPPEDVFTVFAELCESIPESAHEFIPYMEDTYIGAYRYKSRQKPDGSMVFKRQWRDPLFAHSLWNVRERTLAQEPRTNNHLEGWHRRFKTIVDKHHPNIFEFIDKLRGEQARTETTIEQLVAGANPVEGRQKVKKMNEKLLKVVAEYDSRTTMDFLRGIAYNIRF